MQRLLKFFTFVTITIATFIGLSMITAVVIQTFFCADKTHCEAFALGMLVFPIFGILSVAIANVVVSKIRWAEEKESTASFMAKGFAYVVPILIGLYSYLYFHSVGVAVLLTLGSVILLNILRIRFFRSGEAVSASVPTANEV